jgi:IS605 OrfB family transposase
MEIVRTVKVKIGLNANIAKRTVTTWNEACNFISRFAFDNPAFARNTVRLHDALYGEVKSRFGLSAQVVQSAIRQVAAKYRAAKTAKRTLKRPIYFRPHNAVALQGGDRGRDFGFHTGGLSIWTLDGRIKNLAVYGPPKLNEYLNHWQLGDARLFMRKGEVFLAVSFSRTVEPTNKPNDAVVGVDRGVNYLAVATDGQRSQFFGGRRVKHLRNRYKNTRASLQQKKAKKNTRSIRRRLKRLSGKEARFMRDTNHRVSHHIIRFAQATGNPTIAIEKLDGIRENTKGWQKPQRSDANAWAFYQLEQFLQYKAADLGFEMVEIEAKNTSKGCSRCGYADKSNRNGHRFACKACGYSLHADLNAARNIRLRGIVVRQELNGDAYLSVCAEARVSVFETTGKLPDLSGSH